MQLKPENPEGIPPCQAFGWGEELVQAARSAPLGCLDERMSPSYKTGRGWMPGERFFSKKVSKKMVAVQPWEEWVRLWRASGTSAAAFCREHDLNYNSFLYWKSKLDAHAGFTRIDAPSEEEAGIALECQGFTIRLSRGFDELTLRRALLVVRSRC